MATNDKLKKALDTIALKHAEGVVSNDILIKACENYKERIGFEEDFDYDMKVAKSCFDFINGVEQDEEISKAIIPGQTKMIDGVMYVYTATPNAKTQYDWRVVKKGSKTGKAVGRGDKLNTAKIDAKQKFVNSLFPKDLSTLKVVKSLGGSTGAVLVEDVNGNQYVMKKGSNTNAGHVKSEYLANQLYDVLGQRVPDYELYEDDNGETVLLSKFIPMTRAPKPSDYAEMAKGWVADVVLANWDVYKNDNCLIDSAGRVIRVDNGGCLDYRAQGGKKNYDEDVVETWKGMVKHNQSIFGMLDTADLIAQIDDIQKRKDDIVGYLQESGDDKMAKVIGDRIKKLTEVKNYLLKQQRANKPNTTPRQLKPANEMYRKFTDDELQYIWDAQSSSTGRGKLFDITSGVGWTLLSDICKERGFDARPRVVDDATYWGIVAKSKHPQLFRGLTSGGGYSADVLANMFKHDDDCFYGTIGIYGEGIYAHVNDGKNKSNGKADYRTSDAYHHATNYSGGSDSGILLMAFEDDAKIAKVDDLIAEIRKNPPLATDTKALQDEADAIKADLDKVTNTLANLTQTTISNVKSTMHYDDTAVAEMQLEIENTDWGALDEDGEPDYPSWHDFVETKMCDWVRKNGGTATPEHGQITFTLPNSESHFTLTQRQYEVNAIKRRNTFSPAYSFPIKRFEDWFTREHITKVDAAIKDAVDNLGDKVNELKGQISDLTRQHADKMDEIKKQSCPDPNESIYNAIYDSVVNEGNKEPVGIYAAMKGYDALIQPHGNGSSNSFAIILNRSKIIVKQ